MSLAEGIDTRNLLRGASRVITIGIVVGSLIAFGWVASGAFQSTENLTNVRWTPFVGAIALQFTMLFVLMLIWERLLGFLWKPAGSETERPTRSSLYTAYSRSWLARYIPGRIWALSGRALLANKLGVPVEAVARSMAFEVLFTYGIVTIIGAALFISAKYHVLSGGAILIVGLVAFTASVPVVQGMLSSWAAAGEHGSFLSRMRQGAHRLLVGETPLTFPNTMWGIAVYGFYSVMQLGFIVLIASSFAELNLEQASIIAGAWGLSITLGWVTFLAPVGLGVRDGLAFVLFAQVLDAPTASLIVASSRLVMLATDLVFVGAIELLAVGLNVRQTQPQTFA